MSFRPRRSRSFDVQGVLEVGGVAAPAHHDRCGPGSRLRNINVRMIRSVLEQTGTYGNSARLRRRAFKLQVDGGPCERTSGAVLDATTNIVRASPGGPGKE